MASRFAEWEGLGRIGASRGAAIVGRDAALLVLYAAGFWGAHAAARGWADTGFYSLFYPAAGLRLALLWRRGAAWAWLVAPIELCVDLATGMVVPRGNDGWIDVLAVLRPGFAYGSAVWAVRRLTDGAQTTALLPPMTFAIAAVAAPLATTAATLPQSLLRGDLTGVVKGQEVVLSLSALLTGDLLGVLVIAPPLIWWTGSGRRQIRLPSRSRMLADAGEIAVVVGSGASTWTVLSRLGLGPQPAPALMAVTWIGLRHGRAAAWVALATMCAVVLPHTQGAMSTPARLQFHLGLASVLVAGYLAASYRDAQVRARQEVTRRDRLLFQAERLKTLRAMSVAIVHEIAQPLSTLAIEARHLRDLTAGATGDLADTASLVDRKAAHLSDLVRRLRAYGGRASGGTSVVPIDALLDAVASLAAPEADAAKVNLVVVDDAPGLGLVAQEVELTQALLNLVRNAIQACQPFDRVRFAAGSSAGDLKFTIANPAGAMRPDHGGMGVGTLIAQAIVQAHGGQLTRVAEAGVVTATVILPHRDAVDA